MSAARRTSADPEKLVASAARLYGGEEGLARLWGEVVPSPEENLRVLEGGETVEGAFRVEYTPGHASHHVCYFHEADRQGVRGGHGGRRVPPDPFTLAPTPPPDIDLEAWERSLDVDRGWEPEAARADALGAGRRPAAQLERVRESLHEQARMADGNDVRTASSRHTRSASASRPPATPRRSCQAAPPDQLWLGLDRSRSKSGQVS